MQRWKEPEYTVHYTRCYKHNKLKKVVSKIIHTSIEARTLDIWHCIDDHNFDPQGCARERLL